MSDEPNTIDDPIDFDPWPASAAVDDRLNFKPSEPAAFDAEVLFYGSDNVARGTEALKKVSCNLEVIPDLKDPEGEPYVWTWVTGSSELAQGDIGSWLCDVLRGCDADILEWGYGPPWQIRD